ncbi:hypothetical protein FQN60_002963 [Etheostoma spectabile]|uniref:Pyrin domain-containing protein n=1 Tax=Etheostoma spectabile TaxID=54343 RepID=A0A5J5CHQ9_9PERO|nr:hypothetical protein FQN60_002963 [Etheostoma spectabile]
MSAPAPEPVRIEKVLKEHLDDLSEDELRDFQWYVTLHRGTDSKPVPKSQLQNASRTETVDKLVSFHGESGAVEITVDILMNHMNHNDLATRSITEKREAFEKVKEFCDSSIEQIKTQRHYAKKKITDDFEKLHLVLKREQETSIAELEEEATQKIGMMQKITELSRDTFSLSVTIKDLHDLGADNSLLQNFRTEMERPIQPLPSDSDTDEDEDNEGPRFLDNNYKDNEGPRVLDHEDNEGPPDFLLTDVEELELYFEDDLYC